MKLLSKTIAIILFSFLLLLGASLSFYRLNVMGDFLKIENDIVEKDASRVIEAIEAERHLMKVTAIDWAQWDDMYNYMHTPNKKFEESWTTYESYKALKITDTVFFNLKKKAVFAVHVNFEEETVETSAKDKALVDDVVSLPGIFDFSGDIPSQAIFGTLKGKPVLAAASPILDSNRSKPSRGYMVIIKQIDQEFISKIAEQTRLSLTVLDSIDSPENTRVLSALAGGRQAVVRKIDDKSIQAFMTLSDGAGAPLILMRVDESRPVYNQGLANLKLFVGFWVIASFTAILLAVILLNSFIIVRLRRVCSFLNKVGSKQNFDDRLPQRGSDELAKLSADINQMLSELATAHASVVAAQKQAEAANYAKSTFIARVSHELRNPIHGIRGINHLILKRESSKAVGDLVKMGDSAAESLLSIVDEILDFSKAEAGELTFESIPYDVRQIVRETMQVAAARLEGKYRSGEAERVQLICQVDSRLPLQLKGDPTRLKQVFINLLTNAVKFTERGCVGLKLEAGSNVDSTVELKISVWDTGIGIPPDKIDTLFTPFKQADETIARKYQGTGLGLSIVKQFVEGLGGSVSVKSVQGEGSTFEVTLKQPVAGDFRSAAELLSSKLPKETYLAAVHNIVAKSLVDSLSTLGAEAVAFNPLAASDTNLVQAGFKTTGLLIVSEEALAHKTATKLLSERIQSGIGCTAVLLRPSSLELREQLYSQGLKLIFTLPVLADDILTAYAAGPSLVESVEENLKQVIDSIKKLRVIIADDAPTNRIILQEMLEDSGHEVVPVGDGKDILSLVTPMLTGQEGAEHYDLVITDVSMAIMNGDEAARRIRDLESTNSAAGHIPIIAVTGQAFESELNQIRESGIDGILTKPMHPSQLEAELARLFRS